MCLTNSPETGREFTGEPNEVEVVISACDIEETIYLAYGSDTNVAIANAFNMMPQIYDAFEIAYKVNYDCGCQGELEQAVEAYFDEGKWDIHVYEKQLLEKN